MPMTKYMLLVAGVPGVGKTTISTRLAQELGGQILQVDDFKKAVVDPSKMGEEIDPQRYSIQRENPRIKYN